ncbi:hypothetical protein SAMN05216236_13913 [Sedimentitalea nanhaiensis]|uniref:Uncharacterized protein n=1 Tax=Sedimentitalea nanhaiensis TaxID=999627 RepID=A0A1I7DZW1_9RHOB|nr:hypothetical protein SAMN05216236_13913 [Sedimentitalea nanhaiensis]
MFGAAPWSTTKHNEAVIWGRDQGDLAHYRRPEWTQGVRL